MNKSGDLKKNIEYLIGMERKSGSMEVCSPLYISRMLNVPLEEVLTSVGICIRFCVHSNHIERVVLRIE